MRIVSDEYNLSEKWIKINNSINESNVYNNAVERMAITEFLNTCTEKGFDYVTAKVKCMDDSNLQRVENLYMEMGFNVKTDSLNYSCNIYQKLN